MEDCSAETLLNKLLALRDRGVDLSTISVDVGSRCCGGEWDGDLELSVSGRIYLTGNC